MSLEDSCFQVIPNHFFEKVIRLQRAQEGDSGSISFAAFRLGLYFFCGFQTLRA
jgi:hypothetical protein